MLWTIFRIGNLCKLHLLDRKYKPGDDVIGILDFADTNVICAKYICVLKCGELFEVSQEFALGLKQSNFVISVPQIVGEGDLNCALSFLFYIVDKNYQRVYYEDRAGVAELGPINVETKPFKCDFPIVIQRRQDP